MELIKYIGLPYKIGETDCWALVKLFAKQELNKELPEYMYSFDETCYDVIADKTNKLADGFMPGWTKQALSNIEIGDLLTFRVYGRETHCGVYVGDGDFLHTMQGRNSCLEKINNMSWKHRLTGVYRYGET